MELKDTVVFLDIDGVLVSIHKSVRDDNGELVFNNTAIDALNKITDYLDADIILSSSWRENRTIENIRELFKERGIKAYVRDYTPFKKINPKESRGQEIKNWLDLNQTEYFLVIDDDFVSSTELFGHNNVLPINSYRGLDDYDALYVCGLIKFSIKYKPFLKVK